MSKNKMTNNIKFSNLWPELLDWKHHILKNYKVQSQINQTLKDKTRRKKTIMQKDIKQEM
jgi:hypothetical protein